MELKLTPAKAFAAVTAIYLEGMMTPRGKRAR
jgi:hypothetical protein